MNWLAFIAGIPIGLLISLFVEKLLKKAKVKNKYLQFLFRCVPVPPLVLLIIVVGNL